jgi:glycosyltransferase involved in cell wall biosynthesis
MATNEIPQSGTESIGRSSDLTNLGNERTQSIQEIDTAERMTESYGLDRNTFDSYLGDIERTQQAWTKSEIDEKSGETSRLKKIATTVAEIAVPLMAGTATDALLDFAGAAGGPLVSAAVGAASGATRAIFEYRHVGADGRNAAEFWQKNVGSKDKKTETGNILQRGWGHLSRFLKGGSYLGVEAGFKVKERDEGIKQSMKRWGIETDAIGNTLVDADQVYSKLEQQYEKNPSFFHGFVHDLMVQSVLSNFAEQKTPIEQKQMSDLFCLANAVLYKKSAPQSGYPTYPQPNSGYPQESGYPTPVNNSSTIMPYVAGDPSVYPQYPEQGGYPTYGSQYPEQMGGSTELIDKLWAEARAEVKDIVAKTKTYFIVGAAAERAIKSAVGFVAIKWLSQGLEKIGELKENGLSTPEADNAKGLLENTNKDIDGTKAHIADLKARIEGLSTPATETPTNTLDYKAILEPAAKASGQDIDSYLSIPERTERINDLPEIIKALQDPAAIEHIKQISEAQNIKPEDVLNSEILRWTYDSDKYSNFGEMLSKLADNDPRALASLQSAYENSKNVHPAWTELAKNLLEGKFTSGGDSSNNAEELAELQKQLFNSQDRLSYLEYLKGQYDGIIGSSTKELRRAMSKAIFDAGTRGVLATATVMADMVSSTDETYMYGEKSRQAYGGEYPVGYGGYPGNSPRIESDNRNNLSFAKIFLPRKFTERFQRPPLVGFNREGWRDQNLYRQDASPEYLSGNNPTRIISEYLGRESSQSREYVEAVKNVAQSLPEIKDSCRVSIAIPALGEEASMKDTLSHFLKLNNPENFEICILDTHPINSNDDSERIVREFAQNNPSLNIVYIKREVEQNTNVGESRKFLTDVILQRAQNIADEQKKGNYAIISQDADLELIESPDYVNRVIESFEKESTLEILQGRRELAREALIQAPSVLAAWRTWNTFDRFADIESNAVNKTIGMNTAFRATTLAGVGGYNPNLKVGEDLELGWRVRNLKGNERVKYSPSIGLQGEARRALTASLTGLPIVYMYTRFHENSNLRDKDWQTVISENKDKFKFTQEGYTKEVQALYNLRNREYSWLVPDGKFDNAFKSTMNAMGVEYTIDNGRVNITKMNKNIDDVIAKEQDFLNKEQNINTTTTQAETTVPHTPEVQPNKKSSEYWGFSSSSTNESEKNAATFLDLVDSFDPNLKGRILNPNQTNKLENNEIQDIKRRMFEQEIFTSDKWLNIYREVQRKAHPDANAQADPERKQKAEEMVRFMNNFNDILSQRSS